VIRALVLLALALVLLPACGGDDDSADAETTTVRVYFLRDDAVWPVAREIEETGDSDQLVTAAMLQLFSGPTDEEEAELGLSTALEPEASASSILDVDGGYSLPGERSEEALAQFVYTLSQFPGLETVEVDGESYSRASFEDQTPPVLVESPLAFEEVTSPLRATGTANTFEANFQYEVLDAEGSIVTESFVTATSGTGTRGTFDFTTADLGADGDITLVVFELSAEDGSRMNEVEIPLVLSGG
jgi:germination protein M